MKSRNKTLFTTFQVITNNVGREEIVYTGTPPMTLQEAFWKTIAKWEFMRNNPHTYVRSSQTCGLCNLFVTGVCVLCPIQREGYDTCHGSPYTDWMYARQGGDTGEITTAIDKELAFLREIAAKYGVSVD